MWCNFLIFKTNYFWSNRGIVCLIISVLGYTQTQNILHEKNVVGYSCEVCRGDFKNGVKKNWTTW